MSVAKSNGCIFLIILMKKIYTVKMSGADGVFYLTIDLRSSQHVILFFKVDKRRNLLRKV
jgi:hypothetical protein